MGKLNRKYNSKSIILGGLWLLLSLFAVYMIGRMAVSKLDEVECRDAKAYTLGEGFIRYDKLHGFLPSGNTYRSEGEQVVTWRVALLQIVSPYGEVAKTYRFTEIWDGPYNSRLHAAPNPGYHCPLDSSPQAQTSYVRISGPSTPFPDDRTVSVSELEKGASNTIFAAEMHNSGIHWMEPRDITLEQAVGGIRQTSKPTVRTRHGLLDLKKGTYAVFADGSVRWLNSNIDPKLLRSLLEIDNPDKPREKYTSP